MSGGSHITQAFDVSNYFENPYLNQLDYPLIYVGSFLDTVWTFLDTKKSLKTLRLYTNKNLIGPNSSNIFTQYFNHLNEPLPNYQKAAETISGMWKDESAKIKDQSKLSNYVSIKFPHTSWLTPIEMKNVVKKISQIDASTRKAAFNIADNIDIILLSATNIPTGFSFNGFTQNLPYFLPANYQNQNYVIEQIDAPDLIFYPPAEFFDGSLNHYINDIMPLPSIQEPINIVIKEFKPNSKRYTNLYLFTHHKVDANDPLATTLEVNKIYFGYIYTNPEGLTKITAWNNQNDDYQEHQKEEEYDDDDDEFYPAIFDEPSIIEKDFDPNALQQLIAQVETKATKGLKTVTNIEQTVAKKAKGIIPQKIQRSRQEHENIEKISNIIDLLHTLPEIPEQEDFKIFKVIDIVHELNQGRNASAG